MVKEDGSTKPCNICGEIKPLEEFSPDSQNRDRRRGICKVCTNRRAKEWQAAHPERKSANYRKWMLRKRYGITPEQFDDLLAAQDGCCACCGTDTAGGQYGTFHVDHDHTTGKIRGLLCYPCNTGIGKLGDTLEGVERAASYMRRTSS